MASFWTITKEAALKWSQHRDARQGAALAYYSVFSIGPVVVIAVAIAGLAFGREAVNGEVAASIKDMMGDTGAKAVQAMLADASRPRQGVLATALGFGALLFAAIGVIVQLKDALNVVCEVKETQSTGMWPFLRSYVISLAAVLALGFLLLTSMVVTALVAAFASHAAAYVQEWVLHLLSSAVSFAAVSILFAMMFKWLPDTSVDWYDVWLGAIVTGLLFELGKVRHWLLHRQTRSRIDLRCRSFDRRRPYLGLLLRSDRADGRRDHPRFCTTSRVSTDRKSWKSGA
jgi:membrane protein